MGVNEENFSKEINRAIETLMNIYNQVYGKTVFNDINNILPIINSTRRHPPQNEFAPFAAFCLNHLFNFLLYPEGKTEHEEDASYRWAINEALFYSIAANIRRLGSLTADYGFYASATVLGLRNLLNRCFETESTAIIFIATTQTPGELAVGGSALSTSPNKYEIFDDINNNYKLQFRTAIEEFTGKGVNIVIERHIFARDKLFTRGKSKKGDRHSYLRILERYLEKLHESIQDKTLRSRVTPSEVAKFKDWINKNHICKLPDLPPALPEKMARVHWFEPPTPQEMATLHWNPNFICTDLIAYGSSRKKRFDPKRIPPTFDSLDIRWEFALQSIDLGVPAEGRVVRPVMQRELSRGKVNFLGFEDYYLKDLIRCLQENVSNKIDNPLGLTKSDYVTKLKPWEQLWTAGSTPNYYYDLFISYPRRKAEIPKAVYYKLLEKGLKVFIDFDNLAPGDSLSGRLSEAINRSKIFAVFLIDSNESHIQNNEINKIAELWRKDQTRRIIPIYLEEMDDHLWLNELLSIKYDDFKAAENPVKYLVDIIARSL